MARARHDVHGGDPARLRLLQTRIADVDRVEHTHVRMHRCADVATLGAPDMAVRVHQAGHDRVYPWPTTHWGRRISPMPHWRR